MKRALIVGCRGQDGSLLWDLLSQKKYRLVGLDLGIAISNYSLRLKPIDISNKKTVFSLVKKYHFDEIYYLAAYHNSSQDNLLDNVSLLQALYQVNVLSLNIFLEAILRFSPKTKLFYAASSHIFGQSPDKIQTEKSKIKPIAPYGISKASGCFICQYYRDKYGLFASCGILYNHESSLRSEKFVVMKIIKAAIKIKRRKQKFLALGDLNASADWGYAPDYVLAMYKVLQLKKADDFIVATGKEHRVIDIVRLVFSALGLKWQAHVKENERLLTKEKNRLVGCSNKLNKLTGWRPSLDFKQMVKLLLKTELLKGVK